MFISQFHNGCCFLENSIRQPMLSETELFFLLSIYLCSIFSKRCLSSGVFYSDRIRLFWTSHFLMEFFIPSSFNKRCIKILVNTEAKLRYAKTSENTKKAALENTIRKIDKSLKLIKIRRGLGFDLRPSAIKRFWVSHTNHSATHAADPLSNINYE